MSTPSFLAITRTGLVVRLLVASITLASTTTTTTKAQECFTNDSYNEFFATENPTCCQNDVCAIPCPEPVPDPTKGYGIAVAAAVVVSFLIGVATLFLVKGKAENFFIAGKSLPLWMVSFTLGAQSVDSNALLGNADLTYKYQFWDGAVLPIGLGLSLLLNALFLARHINSETNVLTLPDVLAKRYGKVNEILVSCATLVSFIMLLAGNLVGMGVIISYTWGIKASGAIWTGATIVWAYTVSGGIFSIAYTDVAQGVMGWSGALVCAYYLIATTDINAPPPSLGFPGYIYPDGIGEDGVCDMHQGVPCANNPDLCCYNTEVWCPSDDNCTTDNGAYPIGDQPIFKDQMTNYLALSPFPNAMFWNWSTIIILAVGNLAALDFQGRCLAAKTPQGATWGCVIGGLISMLVGIPFSYMGSITRYYYGPDSVHAEFIADSCNVLLGLPTCAAWVPDPLAFVKLLTHQVPPFLGGWCLVGIVAASMSTASGAILAMGTVFSHNVVRQLDAIYPNLVTSENLLLSARLGTVPLTLSSALIAAYYQSDNPSGATGYLLIVAFDVVLATVVVPLFGCFYAKTPRPTAAFLSIICGASTRIIMEFTLPKDGFLLLPYEAPEYLNYGLAASTSVPTFVDAPEGEVWKPSEEVCQQPQYEDYTGVDSLTALAVSFVVYVTVQFLEEKRGGKPLFYFPGLDPYEKVFSSHVGDDDDDDVAKKDVTVTTHTEERQESDENCNNSDSASSPSTAEDAPAVYTEESA